MASTRVEVLLVRRREVSGFVERRDVVVGGSVGSAGGVRVAEEVDPERIETGGRPVGDVGLRIVQREIHDQRLRRVADDQERAAALVDEVAVRGTDLERERNSRARCRVRVRWSHSLTDEEQHRGHREQDRGAAGQRFQTRHGSGKEAVSSQLSRRHDVHATVRHQRNGELEPWVELVAGSRLVARVVLVCEVARIVGVEGAGLLSPLLCKAQRIPFELPFAEIAISPPRASNVLVFPL